MKIENQIMDEERALYHLTDAEVIACTFEGEADGESALKECREIAVKDCKFRLRYPLWHTDGFSFEKSCMEDGARAPVWYAKHGVFRDSKFDCVKFLRECEGIRIERCEIKSPEAGWSCRDVVIEDSAVDSVYFLLGSRDIRIKRLQMTGNYSFQYVERMQIEDSALSTKDMFWHAKDVLVKDSEVHGEYLGWYSEGLTFENCEIYGTQPFCYCKRLKLVNCTLHGCDRAFEYSDVNADLIGHVDSIKNPLSGTITLDSVGEIIRGGAVLPCSCEIILRGKGPLGN